MLKFLSKSLLPIFLFIIINYGYSYAEISKKITVEEIENILFGPLEEREKFTISKWEKTLSKNFSEKKELQRLNDEYWDERYKEGQKRMKEYKKRQSIKGIAKCLYEDGDPRTADHYEKRKICSSKVIRTIFTRSEIAGKKRPGDTFYALDAIAVLTRNNKQYDKFVKVFTFEEGDKPIKNMWCYKQHHYSNYDQKFWTTCFIFRKSFSKKIEKFKIDPNNEKLLGHSFNKFIKQVRLIDDIEEKIGTDNFAIIGDMLNDSVANVKKNNISKDLEIRRLQLKKYSLILSKIRNQLIDENYKSLKKNVIKLSKSYENLKTLKPTKNNIALNIDESINIISETNNLIQKTVLKAENNQEEKLMVLALIKFMNSLLNSIMNIIPDKYYVEAKLLNKDNFDKNDLEKLDLIVDQMIKKNKETKLSELNKSMDKIDQFIKPLIILKKLENLGIINETKKTFTQDVASEIAKQQLKDNLDNDILQSAKKIIQQLDQRDLNEITKEATQVAQEVTKEVSNQASTAAWATTKPGNYNVKHLIAASRDGKISWDIGRR